MFWNKKNTVEFDGLPVVLSIRNTFNLLSGKTIKQFLAYKTQDGWKGLVGHDQFREEVDEVNTKLDLILKHLNLEYVRETKKREPAKLVEKLSDEKSMFYNMFLDNIISGPVAPEEPKKKKKGRPKKK